MTVRKGSSWGEPGAAPAGVTVVDTDRALARAASLALDRGEVAPVFGLTGGDLHRTLGSPPPERLHTAAAMWLPIDLVRVELDGQPECFVAHLVVGGRTWFRGRTVMAMNAAFVGDANLGPRAHPGDGLLDVVDGRLDWADRRAARRRLGSGTHLPHPGLAQVRRAEWSTTFDRPVPVRLDGEPVGSFRSIRAAVEPDALVVVA
jgi:hypothetical protein